MLHSTHQLTVFVVLFVQIIFLTTFLLLLHVLGILPCSILIPGLFFVPESPRWLVSIPWYYLFIALMAGPEYSRLFVSGKNGEDGGF